MNEDLFLNNTDPGCLYSSQISYSSLLTERKSLFKGPFVQTSNFKTCVISVSPPVSLTEFLSLSPVAIPREHTMVPAVLPHMNLPRYHENADASSTAGKVKMPPRKFY